LNNRAAIITAVVALVTFVAEGAAVSPRPPGALDAGAYAFFYGQATSLAAAFTTAGLFPAYVALCVISLIVGLVRRDWLPRAFVAIAALIVAWQVSDVFKVLFHRARPPHWLVYHETSYSYASGHAVLAMTFWGIWAYYAIRALPASPARTLIVFAIALWVLAIGWSRLALGAHYLTDVIGGYLLGIFFVSLAAIVARYLEPKAERPSTGEGR
jgi:undecaprenyl-diphosphatase